jgi:hypothetical protein
MGTRHEEWGAVKALVGLGHRHWGCEKVIFWMTPLGEKGEVQKHQGRARLKK